jgi:hypothetical protein
MSAIPNIYYTYKPNAATCISIKCTLFQTFSHEKFAVPNFVRKAPQISSQAVGREFETRLPLPQGFQHTLKPFLFVELLTDLGRQFSHLQD